MRILAVLPFYDPQGGGLQRYAHAVLSRLARRHVVEAAAFGRVPSPLQRDGVMVHQMAPLAHFGRTPTHPRFGRFVRERLEAFGPDVVVAHTPSPFAAEVATREARRAGIPFVVTYHAGRLRGSSWMLDRVADLDRVTMERSMLRSSEQLVAVSDFVRDRGLAAHKQRVTVIPPGVDHERFAPRSRGRAPDDRTILFVAPLDSAYRWKGVDVLWDAFQIVHRQMPDVRLRLVGRGDRLVEFRRKAFASVGAVQVAARLDDEHLIDAYRDATVTVLPSTSEAESFGMVLAEANACGSPVVASDVGGIPCFVRHGENGLLAQPDDARDLAHQLGELLDDRGAASDMGRRGRERVVREHDWADLTAKTETVLKRAVAGSL